MKPPVPPKRIRGFIPAHADVLIPAPPESKRPSAPVWIKNANQAFVYFLNELVRLGVAQRKDFADISATLFSWRRPNGARLCTSVNQDHTVAYLQYTEPSDWRETESFLLTYSMVHDWRLSLLPITSNRQRILRSPEEWEWLNVLTAKYKVTQHHHVATIRTEGVPAAIAAFVTQYVGSKSIPPPPPPSVRLK